MTTPRKYSSSHRTKVSDPHTPTLETERLILRPLCLADAKSIFDKWASDEEVARYMSWNTHASIEDTLEWLNFEEGSYNSPDNFNFGFESKESRELIGSGGILYEEELDRYGIGYCLMKSKWGKGYASEASRCFLNYAIHDLGITRFFAYHACANPASGKVLEKLGFCFDKEGWFIGPDNTKAFPRKEYLLDR
jgi:ribosomal-protein-alanine N-acetyltransferase